MPGAGAWQVHLEAQADAAAVQHEHAIAEQHRLLHVVGDEHGSEAMSAIHARPSATQRSSGAWKRFDTHR
jgi:hypothetical protein